LLGLLLLAVAVILKLVIVERLFAVSRNKLMSIPVFAWIYRQYSQFIERLQSTAAWQMARRWRKTTEIVIRRLAIQPKHGRISYQR
jgi:hypothetical protein